MLPYAKNHKQKPAKLTVTFLQMCQLSKRMQEGITLSSQLVAHAPDASHGWNIILLIFLWLSSMMPHCIKRKQCLQSMYLQGQSKWRTDKQELDLPGSVDQSCPNNF